MWIIHALRPASSSSEKAEVAEELKSLIRLADEKFWARNCAQIVSVLLEAFPSSAPAASRPTSLPTYVSPAASSSSSSSSSSSALSPAHVGSGGSGRGAGLGPGYTGFSPLGDYLSSNGGATLTPPSPFQSAEPTAGKPRFLVSQFGDID